MKSEELKIKSEKLKMRQAGLMRGLSLSPVRCIPPGREIYPFGQRDTILPMEDY